MLLCGKPKWFLCAGEALSSYVCILTKDGLKQKTWGGRWLGKCWVDTLKSSYFILASQVISCLCTNRKEWSRPVLLSLLSFNKQQLTWVIPLIFNEINWWSFGDCCKKIIIWTTRFYSRTSKGILVRSKKEGAWNRRQDCAELQQERCQQAQSSLERQRLERQFWWWVIRASVVPQVCLFSLTPDMLPEWMESSLPGFHIPSLFAKGSSTLWHRAVVMCFFLLTTPLMELGAPPCCKQMNWAPPVLPKCTAQLYFPVCSKPTSSLIQFFGTLHLPFFAFILGWFYSRQQNCFLIYQLCP